MIFRKSKKRDQSKLNEYSSDSIRELNHRLKESFTNIKQEFSEHLTSINQNTNEIQSNHEFLCDLDSKIEKLSERIDEISMYLGLGKKEKDYEIKKLTKREQEVFLVLYTLKENSSVTYAMIARKLAFTESLVQTYISNMIAKGVPIIKKYINNHVHFSLDSSFTALQAKENIAGIHRNVSERLLGD